MPCHLCAVIWHFTEKPLIDKLKLAHARPTMFYIRLVICLTHTNVWESIRKPCSCTAVQSRTKSESCKNPCQYYKSRENPYQVLAGYVRFVLNDRSKPKVRIIKSISPSYTEKRSLVCCHWHCYSRCAIVTIKTATNSWYSFVLWWYYLWSVFYYCLYHIDSSSFVLSLCNY